MTSLFEVPFGSRRRRPIRRVIGNQAESWWYDGPRDAEVRGLFKQARQNTGEDWSEKLAAEFAVALGLPAARVELAVHCSRRGITSPSFVPKGGQLSYGNELLGELDPGYPSGGHDVSAHTVDRVLQALDLGNTDRHHENWGVIQQTERELAPTFDHATSLGRERRVEDVEGRLRTRRRRRQRGEGTSAGSPVIAKRGSTNSSIPAGSRSPVRKTKCR